MQILGALLMVYSTQSAALRRDKYQFFSQVSPQENYIESMHRIEKHAKTIEYSFLLNNQQALEVEFNQIFHLLQQQDEHKEQFWIYCYYCASLLEVFHRAYGQTEKQRNYTTIKEQIKKRLNKEPLPQGEDVDFMKSLYDSFLNGFRQLLKAPAHLSQLQDYVAYSNLCRLYWVFCRLTITQSLTVAKNLNLIDKLEVLLGDHIDVDKIISTMQRPNGVLNFFSVAFFLMRFMIDAGLLIKHTFFPSKLEKGAEHSSEVHVMQRLPGSSSLDAYRNGYILLEEAEGIEPTLYYIPKQGKALRMQIKQGNLSALMQRMKGCKQQRLSAQEIKETITQITGHTPEPTTALDRFKHEIYKRHCNFLNDLTWATVNFLANYNKITGLSDPIAASLTAVFLVFDVAMILYKSSLAKKAYLARKAQYAEEIAAYSDPQQWPTMTTAQRLEHISLLNQQLRDLEDKWRTKEATFYFVAAAAALLTIGFTASLLVSAPLLIAASFFVCNLAIAMYFSAETYSNYKEKSLALEYAQLNGRQLPAAQKAYEAARNQFIFTMVKNTIVPMVLITTYAICWPAAVILTAVYLGGELLHNYNQHEQQKEAKKLALSAPQEDAHECKELSSSACCM